MANVKVSELTELDSPPDAGDLFYVVDSSEPSSTASKKVTLQNIASGVEGSIGTAAGRTLLTAADAAAQRTALSVSAAGIIRESSGTELSVGGITDGALGQRVGETFVGFVGTVARQIAEWSGTAWAPVAPPLYRNANNSITANIPNGTATGGNTRGAGAVDLQLFLYEATEIASGDYSAVSGGAGNTASGNGSVVSGGIGNTASGYVSVVSGGSNNTASGQSSAVSGGESNTSSGYYSAASGAGNTASGDCSAVSGGLSNAASGDYSAVSGGNGNIASGISSWIPGGSFASTRSITGANAWSGARRSLEGDNQRFGLVVQVSTTNATGTILTADRFAAGSSNVLVLPNNSMWTGLVCVGARSTSGKAANWIYSVRAKRGTNAAYTVISRAQLIDSDDAELAGSVSIVANTTRGSVEVQVTGIAATTIDWIAEFFGVNTHR